MKELRIEPDKYGWRVVVINDNNQIVKIFKVYTIKFIPAECLSRKDV